MLKCQVEAFKNEVDLIRHEHKTANQDKENQTKMLQQVLQGMQQVNITAVCTGNVTGKYYSMSYREGGNISYSNSNRECHR